MKEKNISICSKKERTLPDLDTSVDLIIPELSVWLPVLGLESESLSSSSSSFATYKIQNTRTKYRSSQNPTAKRMKEALIKTQQVHEERTNRPLKTHLLSQNFWFAYQLY